MQNNLFDQGGIQGVSKESQREAPLIDIFYEIIFSISNRESIHVIQQ